MRKYNRVKLKTDKYISEGVKCGDAGFIIEEYDDGNFEVEFSNPKNGITIALIVASPQELELVEE